jgi:integrase
MKMTRAVTNIQDVNNIAHGLNKFDLRFSLLWKLGLVSGLRISDLLTLRASTIGTFGSMEVKEKKTGKTKRMELGHEIALEVSFYVAVKRLKKTDYLFYSREQKKDKPMSRQWAHRVIARTAQNKGLEFIGAHSMRKTYACDLFRSTGKIEAVQASLNHKYPSTTLTYLKDLLFQTVHPANGS